MWIDDYKAAIWTRKIVKRNLKVTKPIDCEQFIHPLDKTALQTLKKIPLLDSICAKLISVMNDRQNTIINMSTKIHITEKQLSKVYKMVKSICCTIGIEMPEVYLELDREPNAYTYGTHKFTMRPLGAMGVGLCLDLPEMEEVLSLGGMTFIKGNREHEAYKYLFTAFYGQDIDVCNAFLKEVDVPLLGTQQRL